MLDPNKPLASHLDGEEGLDSWCLACTIVVHKNITYNGKKNLVVNRKAVRYKLNTYLFCYWRSLTLRFTSNMACLQPWQLHFDKPGRCSCSHSSQNHCSQRGCGVMGGREGRKGCSVGWLMIDGGCEFCLWIMNWECIALYGNLM